MSTMIVLAMATHHIKTAVTSWAVDILERALENLRQRHTQTEEPESRAGGGEGRPNGTYRGMYPR